MKITRKYRTSRRSLGRRMTKLRKKEDKDMECTVYDEKSAMELWRKMKEIMTSGKTTGEILDELEKLYPEFEESRREGGE